MKLNGRTLLLSSIALQLCFLYSVLYESIKSLQRDDHSYIHGADDFYSYVLGFTIISLLATVANAALFAAGMLGHKRWKKNLAMGVLLLHVILILPYHLSGLYLHFSSKSNTEIGPDLESSYKDFQKQMNAPFNVTLNGEDSAVLSALHRKVHKVNNRYCCCGLVESAEFGDSFDGENVTMAIYTMPIPNTTFTCPTKHLNAVSTLKGFCLEKKFEGCAQRIPRVQQLFILVFSVIGLVCAILSLLTTPFLYAYFEMDRRLGRAAYIRGWMSHLKKDIAEARREQMSCESKPSLPSLNPIDSKKSTLRSSRRSSLRSGSSHGSSSTQMTSLLHNDDDSSTMHSTQYPSEK